VKSVWKKGILKHVKMFVIVALSRANVFPNRIIDKIHNSDNKQNNKDNSDASLHLYNTFLI